MSARFTSAWFIAHEAARRTKKQTQRIAAEARRKSEADIQQEIAGHLNSYGRDCYYVWHRTDRATTCAVGTPDFVGWLRGKPFAMEVKKPGGKPTVEQAGELLRCELSGGSSAVVHSLAEAVEFLNNISQHLSPSRRSPAK